MRWIWLVLVFLSMALLAACDNTTADSTPTLRGAVVPTRVTRTPSPEPTATETPTPSATVTASPSPTTVPSETPTNTVPASPTTTHTASATSITPTSTAEEPPPTAEPRSNTSPGQLAYGDTTRGTIDTSDPAASFQFEGEQGDRISISMARHSGNLDALVKLLAPTGTVLAENDDDPQGSGSSDAFLRDYVLPIDGTYTIVATRYDEQNGDTAGEFELLLLREQ